MGEVLCIRTCDSTLTEIAVKAFGLEYRAEYFHIVSKNGSPTSVGSLRIKEGIHDRQLLIKHLAVLQVLAVESVTASNQR